MVTVGTRLNQGGERRLGMLSLVRSTAAPNSGTPPWMASYRGASLRHGPGRAAAPASPNAARPFFDAGVDLVFDWANDDWSYELNLANGRPYPVLAV